MIGAALLASGAVGSALGPAPAPRAAFRDSGQGYSDHREFQLQPAAHARARRVVASILANP